MAATLTNRERLAKAAAARAGARQALAKERAAKAAPAKVATAGAASVAAMAVPGAGEAELALSLASKGVEVLKSDIVVLHGQRLRRRRLKYRDQVGTTKSGKPKYADVEREVFTPLDWELHVNGVSMTLAAIGSLIAVGLGALAWNGIATGGIWTRSKIQVVPGLKDSEYWQGAATRAKKVAFDITHPILFVEGQRGPFSLNLEKLRCEAAGGTWDPVRLLCVMPNTNPESSYCQKLFERYQSDVNNEAELDAIYVHDLAKKAGCKWAQYP